MPTKTVIPIPPAYDSRGRLDFFATTSYLEYLEFQGVITVMTTAGTSQFNLLSTNEVHLFNETVASNFDGDKILGIPALSTTAARDFIDTAEEYASGRTNFMALYPDRFYSSDTIVRYVSELRERSSRPLYLHGMFMRSGTGGMWNYTPEVVNEMAGGTMLAGLKEEVQNLASGYNFVKGLDGSLDVIVAGGSMRRHQYLKTAGANAFLGGIGNLFPGIELAYCQRVDEGLPIDAQLDLESRLFGVFMKLGWHRSLRIGLSKLGLTCQHDRQPWPQRDKESQMAIENIIEELVNET